MRYLFILIFTISCISFGQEVKDNSWILIYSDDEGEKWYLNMPKENSIGVVSIWAKKEGNVYYFKNLGRKKKLKDGYILLKFEFSCQEDKLRIVSNYTYDSKGNVKYFRVDGKAEWSYIVPGSTGKYISEFVCDEY